MSDWVGNEKSIYVTLGASNHTDKEREENDYYATDPIAIDRLLSKHFVARNVWECACGELSLSNRLEKYGKEVYSSDKIIRSGGVELDFLTAEQEDVPFRGYCDIVTNPPYKYAMEFVLKALELIRIGYQVSMFLKLQFLEGKKRYKELFSKYPPKEVLVFSERIKCAKNGKFEEVESSAVAYAWYIWEKGYKGDTTIKWI